jgi:hypothetical protein
MLPVKIEFGVWWGELELSFEAEMRGRPEKPFN